jgi:menaquinone-dependent protoporphyrinogen IX oxidase
MDRMALVTFATRYGSTAETAQAVARTLRDRGVAVELLQQLDKELARHPTFKPVACRIVGGTFDPKRLGFPWKFIPAMRKIPVTDARDWTTIRRWSDLAPLLHGEPAVSVARE